MYNPVPLSYYGISGRRFSQTKCFWSKLTSVFFILLSISLIIYFTETYKHYNKFNNLLNPKCEELNKTKCQSKNTCTWSDIDGLCSTKSKCFDFNQTKCKSKNKCKWDNTEGICNPKN